MLVAVNGVPGAGKSSIYARLKELGYDAWDTDVDGLSEWRDRATKAPVAEPVDWHDPVETGRIEYRVRRDRVAELRRRARDHTVYLCGCAGGEEEFWDLLDLVICVSVDDDTLRHRLATRTTNDYGKAPHELASIVAANATWGDDYQRMGAIVIDGTKPLDDVVADVVRVSETATALALAGSETGAMPAFVPGLELNKAFYDEVVRPIVAPWSHGAARIGIGSDVLGYDDATSTDHGWGLLLRIFVAEHVVDEVRRAIDGGLPESFRDRPTRFRDPGDDRPPIHHVVVSTVRGWLLANLGVDPRDGLCASDWLVLPQQKLLEVTRGEVYNDDAHELRDVRSLLEWYPNDVWYWMLASQWRRIAQEEAFVGRAAEVGDELGSRLIAGRLARDLMRLWFLLERVYWPYSKWFGTAFARLPDSAPLRIALEEAVTATDGDARESALVRAYEITATRHNSKGITPLLDARTREYHNRGYRVLSADRFSSACLDLVSSTQLRSLPLTGSIDQAFDTADVLSHVRHARSMRSFYERDDA